MWSESQGGFWPTEAFHDPGSFQGCGRKPDATVMTGSVKDMGTQPLEIRSRDCLLCALGVHSIFHKPSVCLGRGGGKPEVVLRELPDPGESKATCARILGSFSSSLAACGNSPDYAKCV